MNYNLTIFFFLLLLFRTVSSYQEERVKEFQVYPNPSNGLVNIEVMWLQDFEFNDVETELEVYNSNGQLLMKRHLHIYGISGVPQFYDNFNLTQYSSGIYLIKINAYGYLLFSKLVLIK